MDVAEQTYLVVPETPLESFPAMLAMAAAGWRVTFAHAPVFAKAGAAAVCTCERGLECTAKGKHPILKAWQKQATHDAQALQDQRSTLRVPRFNVSLVLGAQLDGSYVVAVDVDDAARLAVIEAALGPLPETATVASARGDKRLYRLPMAVDEARIKNVTGLSLPGENKSVPGIDVKAKNGQIIIAPSEHETGASYVWTRTGQVADLPAEWVYALLEPVKTPKSFAGYTPQTMRENKSEATRARRYLEGAVGRACSQLSAMGKGLRNDTLYREAFALMALARGSCLSDAHRLVCTELERAAMASGLDRREVRSTLASAERGVHESGATRGMPVREVVFSASEAASDTSAEPLAPLPEPAPAFDLIRDQEGKPLKAAENVQRLLVGHPDMAGGPRFDAFRRETWWPATALFGEPRAIRDTDTVFLQGWMLQLPYRDRVSVGLDITRAGLEAAAERNRTDSLTAFLTGLPAWDGVPRSLVSYFQLADTATNRLVCRRWLVSAMARALQPGCMIRGMLVLEGVQGIGKNRGLAALFGSDYYRELGSVKLESRDADQLAETAWCLHDDEFRGAGSEVDALKSFLTRSVNSYVPKYGRAPVTIPRRCTMVASTNRTEYLSDEENDRFWPVRITAPVDVAGLERDRLQIFAEHLSAYHAGEPWWISGDDTLKEEQGDRREANPLVEKVRGLIALHPGMRCVTTSDIMDWSAVPLERRDRRLQLGIAQALRELQYERKKCRSLDGSLKWGFFMRNGDE